MQPLSRFDPELLARVYGAARVVIGAALVVAPATAGRTWIGEDAEGGGTRVALRALGVRDLAIGAGLLDALGRGGSVERWLEAGTAADLVDALATLGGADRRRSAFAVLAAASGVVLGVHLRRELADGA